MKIVLHCIVKFSVSLHVCVLYNKCFLSRTSVCKAIVKLVNVYFTLQPGSQYDTGVVSIVNVMGKVFFSLVVKFYY